MNRISVNENLNNSVYAPQSLSEIRYENGYKTIYYGRIHFETIGIKSENPINIGFDLNVAGSAVCGSTRYLGIKNF